MHIYIIASAGFFVNSRSTAPFQVSAPTIRSNHALSAKKSQGGDKRYASKEEIILINKGYFPGAYQAATLEDASDNPLISQEDFGEPQKGIISGFEAIGMHCFIRWKDSGKESEATRE